MSKIHFFRYKYVLFDTNNKKLIQWERGVDRLADLDIIEPIERIPGTSRIANISMGDKPLVSVEIEDEWEEFTVVFTVSHPSQDMNDQMQLDGNVTDIDLLSMQRSNQPESWMPVKFGELIRPWRV